MSMTKIEMGSKSKHKWTTGTTSDRIKHQFYTLGILN